MLGNVDRHTWIGNFGDDDLREAQHAGGETINNIGFLAQPSVAF